MIFCQFYIPTSSNIISVKFYLPKPKTAIFSYIQKFTLSIANFANILWNFSRNILQHFSPIFELEKIQKLFFANFAFQPVQTSFLLNFSFRNQKEPFLSIFRNSPIQKPILPIFYADKLKKHFTPFFQIF